MVLSRSSPAVAALGIACIRLTAVRVDHCIRYFFPKGPSIFLKKGLAGNVRHASSLTKACHVRSGAEPTVLINTPSRVAVDINLNGKQPHDRVSGVLGT